MKAAVEVGLRGQGVKGKDAEKGVEAQAIELRLIERTRPQRGRFRGLIDNLNFGDSRLSQPKTLRDRGHPLC
jgi:hypothetical protein